MTVQEITGMVQAVCAIGGFVFAFLAWWKTRHVPALQKAVVDVAVKVDRVEKATNGMQQQIKDAALGEGFRAGVAQETAKADAVAVAVAADRMREKTSE